MRSASIAGIIFFSLSLSLCIFSLTAHAESVLWSETFSDDLVFKDQQTSGWWYVFMSNPNVSVKYGAQATDATGANVCGTTIPTGTVVDFKFDPHTPQDIFWMGTGNSWDTPNGYWVDNAAQPASCSPADEFYSYSSREGYGTYHYFAALSVAPPQKSVTALSGFTCEPLGSDGSVTCTAGSPGTSQPTFLFAPTDAYFYPGWGQNSTQCNFHGTAPLYVGSAPYTYIGNNNNYVYAAGTRSDDPLDVAVPQQSISCPITVVAASGNPPATPTLNSAGSCTVGTAHSIPMLSTDPNNDSVRYGVDWNSDGSIDQWVPPSGFVPSGTAQTASRTYAIAGAKTVKVLAQDENGNSSSWATLSFNCAGSTTAALNEGGNISGDDSVGGGTQLLPDLDLRVIPSLVRSGNTTKVNWSAANVKSCTVTGQNGDSWTGLQSILGGNISKPITGETTYTLSCTALDGTTLTKSATVRIIPTFQEK